MNLITHNKITYNLYIFPEFMLHCFKVPLLDWAIVNLAILEISPVVLLLCPQSFYLQPSEIHQDLLGPLGKIKLLSLLLSPQLHTNFKSCIFSAK